MNGLNDDKNLLKKPLKKRRYFYRKPICNNLIQAFFYQAVYDVKVAEMKYVEKGILPSTSFSGYAANIVKMDDYLSACWLLRKTPRSDICSKRDFEKWIEEKEREWTEK